MVVVDRNVSGTLELAWLVALLAELGHERAAIVAREHQHSMVVRVDDEQETSMGIERQASTEVEPGLFV